MTTYNTVFSFIIKKIINTENNIFFSNYDNKDSVDFIYKSVFLSFDNKYLINGKKIYFYANKFKFLKDAFSCFTIKENKEEELLDYFCKIQRTYHTLNRFVYKYKYKNAKIVVNKDMELNQINEGDKNIICIYQEGVKYLFKLYDILKIINISLSNSYDFFSEPLCIKNPYNNIPLKKNTLYYIHFYLIEHPGLLLKINFIDLFLKFHSCHFNLTNFLSKYEHLLREHTIHNYIKNTVDEDLYKDLLVMIYNFNKNRNENKKIKINREYPKKKILEIFKPYLLLYIKSKYLLIKNVKNKALFDLNRKLSSFQDFNPNFSRKKITYVKNNVNNKVKVVKIIEDYNSKHIQFNKCDNTNFLNNHLTYKYIHYVINNNIFMYDDYSDTDEENSVTNYTDYVDEIDEIDEIDE